MVDRLVLLADRPDCVAAVAELRCAEWGNPSEQSDLASWVEISRLEAGRDALPVTFVALNRDGDVVGAVGLADHDVPERSDRGPWLVGLVVRRDCRRSGVGRTLTEAVTSLAHGHGEHCVWVATTRSAAVRFYEAWGWHAVERLTTSNESDPVVILASAV